MATTFALMPRPAIPAAPPVVPLPPLSSTASGDSPLLPPIAMLPPLSTPAFSTFPGPKRTSTSTDKGADSPSSSDFSSASFSRASVSTTATGRGTTSTRPSSIEDDAPPPKTSAIPLRPSGTAERRGHRVPVPPLDTPTALLAALELGTPVPAPSPSPALVPGVAKEGMSAVPLSAQELVVQAQRAGPPPVPAAAADVPLADCGCGIPSFPRAGDGAAHQDDDGVTSDEDEDALAAEAEQLLLEAQMHFDTPFPAASSIAGQGKRPSVPLPAIPLGTRRSISGSAFVEEGLKPMPEDHVAEAAEGGVLGAALPEDPTAAPQKKDEKRRLTKVLLKRRRSGTKKGGEFDRFKMPNDEDMQSAAACELVGEGGVPVTFGELIKTRGQTRTVVIFLRHAWCGLCAQYVDALNRATVNLVSLSTSSFCHLGAGGQPGPRIPPLYIVLINSGSPALISTYRSRLETPFPLYSNRSRSLYKALGMTRKSWDMGKDSEKGSYIVKSQLGNITSSISAGMAMRGYPGSQTQLGGEFVFEHVAADDSVKCLYASRMHTTRAHAEIEDVFAAAGVELNAEDAASVYGDLGA